MNGQRRSKHGVSAAFTRNDGYRRLAGPLKTRYLVYLLAVCCQIVSVAQATEYRLVKGKQYPLCQALKKNFDAFRPNPPLMSCGFRFKPEAKLLRAAPWRAVEIADYEVAIRQAYEQIFRPRVPPEKLAQRVESELQRLAANARAGKALLWRADFDFVDERTNGFRSHEIEMVLRLMDNPCDDSAPPQEYRLRWSRPMLLIVAPVQTEHGQTMEMVKRYEYLPTRGFDTFLYDGKARLVRWDWIPLDHKVGAYEGVGAEFYIADPIASERISWNLVCEFEFREQGK